MSLEQEDQSPPDVTELLAQEIWEQRQDAQTFQQNLVSNMMTIFQQILHQQNVPTIILIQSTLFKLDVKISIPLFEGTMNADKLDA